MKNFIFGNIFAKTFAKIYVFQTFSCHVCPVHVTYHADLFSPTCFGCPARPASAVQPQLSGPRCPLQDVLP
jgi:hypothetical protein